MKKPELTLFVAMLAAGLFGTSSAIARQQSAAAAPIGLNVTTVTQQAKTRAVTGNVVDSNGEPVIGATVSAVGAAMKTITDIDGNFRLSLPENVTRLAVSYVGFATETVNVSGRNVVNVRLAEDTNSLDQVVVVGYNLVKRSQITGSIQELSGKKIESNTSSSLEDRMQGRYQKGQEEHRQKLGVDGFSDLPVRHAYVHEDPEPARVLTALGDLLVIDDEDCRHEEGQAQE